LVIVVKTVGSEQIVKVGSISILPDLFFTLG
jgi:desulfoferrodoxin (superoxide reductase-like protein)